MLFRSQTQKVALTDEDRIQIADIERDIEQIIITDNCPELVRTRICRQCSYYDFCFAGERDTDSEVEP